MVDLLVVCKGGEGELFRLYLPFDHYQFLMDILLTDGGDFSWEK